MVDCSTEISTCTAFHRSKWAMVGITVEYVPVTNHMENVDMPEIQFDMPEIQYTSHRETSLFDLHQNDHERSRA